MRMTNKIMQNNSLYNINNNKIMRDKLSTQMSTQKKITRPSDDPVIAIRALRLRTSVSELVQYHEKNAKDAESWLNVTDKSLDTVAAVLTDLGKKANTGANKEYGVDNLKIILEQMKSLRDEFYATGNVDYAGRYIFTGYRTDTPLSFNEKVEEKPGFPQYVITEQNTLQDFDSINYTNIGGLAGLNKDNYNDPNYDLTNVNEQNIQNGDIHRLRLSYDNLSDAADLKMEVNGTQIPVTTAKLSDVPDPYTQMINGGTTALYLPETGEVLIPDAVYQNLENQEAANPGMEIRFTYEKNQWKSGDLRPEHYFACSATDADGNKVNYNQEYLNGQGNSQNIEYDVGYNQKIQVNTKADEVFTHGLDRDIEDLERAISDLERIDAIKTDMDNVLKGLQEGTNEYERVQKQYEAADKAYSYIRENVHDMFQATISKSQSYLDDTNKAVTDNGTRGQRLDLVTNRLSEQKTTFKTLQSENEDADIAEVAIQLTASELTYNAALMATSKIMQTSLMNYI